MPTVAPSHKEAHDGEEKESNEALQLRGPIAKGGKEPPKAKKRKYALYCQWPS